MTGGFSMGHDDADQADLAGLAGEVRALRRQVEELREGGGEVHQALPARRYPGDVRLAVRYRRVEGRGAVRVSVVDAAQHPSD
jgi:hypothetical protein